MIINIIVGITSGILAHQTDYLFKVLEKSRTPVAWLYLARYTVGYLTAVCIQVLMADDENRRDVGLIGVLAGVLVGIGVASGHMIDRLRE